MNELIHADIFFFITTIVVIVLGILVAVILFYVARAFKEIKEIVVIGRREAELLSGDIADARKRVREGAINIRSIITFLLRFFGNEGNNKKTKGRNKQK